MPEPGNFEGLTVEQEIVQVTKDLIEFETVKGREKEFEKAFNYIKAYFEDSDLEISLHEKNGFDSMVIASNKDPEIMFHGHLDVVGAEDSMFQPHIEDGRLYGRGSADMKSGLAALMALMKNTEKDSVGLMIVSDEEIGGFSGAKYLVNKYSPEFFLSAEPNNTETYMEIIVKQKGVIRAEISAEGKNAHGSRPWNGENGAEKLWEKYVQLKSNFSTEKDEWGTTVNLGNFISEGPVNVVPDKASAQLDIRYTDAYTPEKIENDMEKIEGLIFEFNAVDPMLDTSEENSFVQALKESSEDAIGREISIGRKEPASDARHFSDKGIPSVVFGPEGYHVHKDGEYAVISSFSDFYSSLTCFLEKVT